MLMFDGEWYVLATTDVKAPILMVDLSFCNIDRLQFDGCMMLSNLVYNINDCFNTLGRQTIIYRSIIPSL